MNGKRCYCSVGFGVNAARGSTRTYCSICWSAEERAEVQADAKDGSRKEVAVWDLCICVCVTEHVAPQWAFSGGLGLGVS